MNMAAGYQDILLSALSNALPFEAAVENERVIQVERGTILPMALVGRFTPKADALVDRLISEVDTGRIDGLAVVGKLGHRRPVYRGLLVYCWVVAYSVLHGRLDAARADAWERGLRGWCEVLADLLQSFRYPEGALPAQMGGAATSAIWSALALQIAGSLLNRPDWSVLAKNRLSSLVRGQTPEGTFLTTGPADNLESFWYDELVLLHAVASYAAWTRDASAIDAMRRAADYHLGETQPDHASAQPWALLAFIWHDPARALADQMLHSALVQHPAGVDGVSSMLLADALYCLQLMEGT